MNSGFLEFMQLSINLISRFLPIIFCSMFLTFLVLHDNSAKVEQNTVNMMNNTAKSADSGAKSPFFSHFWHHYRHFSYISFRYVLVSSSINIRYSFVNPPLCFRFVNGGRSSSLRRMNEELTRVKRRNRVTSYIEETWHFQVYYYVTHKNWSFLSLLFALF